MHPLSHLKRGAFALASSIGVSQVVSLAVLPGITVFYSPVELGTAQTFATVLGLIAIVAAGKAEHLIAVSDEAEAVEIASAGLCVSLALAAMVCLTVALVQFSPFRSSDGSVYWLLGPSVVLVAMSQVVHAIAARRQCFAGIARTRLTQSLLGAVVILGLGYAHAGVWGLVIAQLVYLLAGTAGLLRVAAPEISSASIWRSRSVVPGILRRNLSLLAAAAASGLLNNLAWALPVLLVGVYYGASEVGLLAIALKCYAPLRALVTATTEQIGTSEGARLLDAGHGPSLRGQTMAMLRVTCAAAGLVVVFSVAAPMLVAPWLPQPWTGVERYLVPLGIVVAIQIAVTPLTCLVVLFRQQTRQVRYDMARACIVGAIFVACGSAASPPHEAMLAYAAGMLLMYGLYTRFFMTLLPR